MPPYEVTLMTEDGQVRRVTVESDPPEKGEVEHFTVEQETFVQVIGVKDLAAGDADDAEVADDADAGETYESWPQGALHDELASRGLPVSGTKDEQMTRLEEDDRAAASSEDDISGITVGGDTTQETSNS